MNDSKQGYAAVFEREQNKKWLFVYAMAKRDIQTSIKFLEKTQENKKDGYEIEANIIALYITYGRIFSKNHDLPILTIDNLKCSLTTDEKSFHESLKILRNKIFAHSDASMNNIQIDLDNQGNLKTVPTHNTSLIEEHHELASSLFNKILEALNEKIDTLLKKLYAQNNHYKVTDNNYVLLGYSNNFWEKYSDKK